MLSTEYKVLDSQKSAYVVGVSGSLYTFSTNYRSLKAPDLPEKMAPY